MNKRMALVTVLAMFPGCAYRTRSATVSRSDLSTPGHTRQTNYMNAPRRWGGAQFNNEDVPHGAGISRAVIADEAELVALDGQQACVQIVVRSGADLDTPLRELITTLNGQPVRWDDELISVRDYDYRGERNVLVADAVTESALASVRLTRPEDRVFRVFERKGKACGHLDGGAHGRVELEIQVPRDDGMGNYGEAFTWDLR